MSERFFESPPWRFVVTDLETETLTFLDKLASSREVVKALNAPMVMSGVVPSADPEINLLRADGYPLLAEGNRLLYGFRNETGIGFNCRAAGIILSVRDLGGANESRSTFQAFDPWEYARRRPVIDADGDFPDSDLGLVFNSPGNEILIELIEANVSNLGTLHIDYGQTSQYAGTIETTETLDIDFQQGMSLGEAFDQLVDTGTMDIVLEPVYDPLNRPGIVSELSIYQQAGSIRREAIFAWDLFSKSLVVLDRDIDGRERANKVRYHVGQGGLAVPTQTDTDSVTDYGQYWTEQFFPGIKEATAVQALAATQLRIRARGLTSYVMSPAPELAPVPIVDYDIGDYVPVYASDRLREDLVTLKRVYSIPLAIDNSQMEAPVNVIVADDEDTTS